MSSYRLVKDEPPKRRGRGGGSTVDITPLLRTLASDPGSWYRFPRDYSGYPNAMKKRFMDEGMETTVASMRNDADVVIGYQLFVRAPNGEAPGGNA